MQGHGLIQGIGVLDVERATVKQAQAILVTRDKVYDFRKKSDARLWDIQALQAGWEWRDIRDTPVPPPGYQLVVKSFKKNGMPVRVPAKRPDEEHPGDRALASAR